MDIDAFKKWLSDRGLGYEHLDSSSGSSEKIVVSKNGSVVAILVVGLSFTSAKNQLELAGY